MDKAHGGARRLKVPSTDLVHLEDLLSDVVRKEGQFNFRSYQSVAKSQDSEGVECKHFLCFWKEARAVNTVGKHGSQLNLQAGDRRR